MFNAIAHWTINNKKHNQTEMDFKNVLLFGLSVNLDIRHSTSYTTYSIWETTHTSALTSIWKDSLLFCYKHIFQVSFWRENKFVSRKVLFHMYPMQCVWERDSEGKKNWQRWTHKNLVFSRIYWQHHNRVIKWK